MTIVKRIGWILVGLLIGILASGSVRALGTAQDRPQQRLVSSGGGTMSQSNAYFIKDTKTGACWLTVRSRDDISSALAPAPTEACVP